LLLLLLLLLLLFNIRSPFRGFRRVRNHGSELKKKKSKIKDFVT